MRVKTRSPLIEQYVLFAKKPRTQIKGSNAIIPQKEGEIEQQFKKRRCGDKDLNQPLRSYPLSNNFNIRFLPKNLPTIELSLLENTNSKMGPKHL